MAIQIDQSWKIEYTEKPTVIADSIGNSVLINAKDKRKIQKIFRLASRNRVFVYAVFAILIATIIFENKTKYTGQVVEIDIEYPGWNAQIKEYILIALQKLGVKFPQDLLVFKLVTKKSLAHNNAYLTYKGKKKPTKIIKLEEILRLIF